MACFITPWNLTKNCQIRPAAMQLAMPISIFGVGILVLLDEARLISDARAYARSLPASEERDVYLGRTPGR